MNLHLQLMLCGFLMLAGLEQMPAAETQTEAKKKPLSRPHSTPGVGHRRALRPAGAQRYLDDHGQLVAAKIYHSRDEFLESVIKPFNARLTKPLVPTIRGLHSNGDTVIALFDGEATALDGKPYRNTYAWFMEMRGGQIVNVTAFFDSIAFDECWKRVQPKENK